MRSLLIVVTTAFCAFTIWVVSRTGLAGFYDQLAASPAAWQVLADISIALGLVLVWMWRDAQAHGRTFWPYVPLTLMLGSIGPLLYLLLRPAASPAVGANRTSAAA